MPTNNANKVKITKEDSICKISTYGQENIYVKSRTIDIYIPSTGI